MKNDFDRLVWGYRLIQGYRLIGRSLLLIVFRLCPKLYAAIIVYGKVLQYRKKLPTNRLTLLLLVLKAQGLFVLGRGGGFRECQKYRKFRCAPLSTWYYVIADVVTSAAGGPAPVV